MKKFMVLMVAVFFASIPSSAVAGNLAAEQFEMAYSFTSAMARTILTGYLWL